LERIERKWTVRFKLRDGVVESTGLADKSRVRDDVGSVEEFHARCDGR
jgi:hypothetical protein